MSTAHRTPPHLFPSTQTKASATPSKTFSKPPLVNNTAPKTPLKSSGAVQGRASSTSASNKAPPVTPRKTMAQGTLPKLPAKSVTVPASKLSQVTSNKKPASSTTGTKASSTSTLSPSVEVSTDPVSSPSTEKDTLGGPAATASDPNLKEPEPPMATLPSDAAMSKMSIGKHAAHIAAHEQAATIHTQHAWNKISTAMLANSAIVTQAVGTLSQIHPAAATALGAVVTQATAALSHISPGAASILSTAAIQATGVLASNQVNGVSGTAGNANPNFDSGSEVTPLTNGISQVDGQDGQGGTVDDTFAEEVVEISLVITALSQEDQIAAIDKDTGEFQVEGILAKFDDPSGAAPDVAIITPTHTFECHMSKLVSVSFFKEVQDAAQTEDPSPPQPVHYQFVVVGGETWSIQPLANHPTDDTRAWDTLNEMTKDAIFNELDLFLKISYGKRPAVTSYAELDEMYITLKAFGMDVPSMNEIISACLAKAKPELGNDIVEYPAAFLVIAQAIGNRKLYLDSFSHVVGRMVFHNMTWDAITAHYPDLADMEAIATKYSSALKSRVEALIALMGKFIWPSIVQTFTAESKRGAFAGIRDPTPEMIRPELTMAGLIDGMKAYRSYMSNELGRNGRGGGYTTLSGRDAQGGHRKLDFFTELPIKEHDDDENDVGIPFAEFTADFEHLT